MLVKFNDGVEVTALVVNGQSRFFQNAQRDSLEFIFKKGDYLFDTLDTYFANKNKTRKITLIDEAQNQFIYDDYVLRVSMSLNPVVISPETSTDPEVTEERISVIMARQTYMEKMIEQLLEA